MYEVTLGGIKIFYNDPHDLVAIIENAVIDVYGFKYLKEGDSVLDLGAGIGEFTTLSSRIIGDSGLVISVEPNPRDYETLNRNLQTNDCKNVASYNNAFSYGKDLIPLEFKGHFFEAKPISLSEIKKCLTEHKKYKFDVIKMDIEGGEADALTLLRDYLAETRSIMIELHGTKVEVDKILLPLGFKFKRLKRSRYVAAAWVYFLRHPITALHLWILFNSTGENPGFKKLFGGIEIITSEELMVVRYEK